VAVASAGPYANLHLDQAAAWQLKDNSFQIFGALTDNTLSAMAKEV